MPDSSPPDRQDVVTLYEPQAAMLASLHERDKPRAWEAAQVGEAA